MTTKEQRDKLRTDIDQIVRRICESDPADPANPDTVCINVNELILILRDSQQPANVDASVEPVAWRYRLKGACDSSWYYTAWADFAASPAGEKYEFQPVYVHPPAAEKGQADERTYEDGVLRAADICDDAGWLHKSWRWIAKSCAEVIRKEAIEQEAKK